MIIRTFYKIICSCFSSFQIINLTWLYREKHFILYIVLILNGFWIYLQGGFYMSMNINGLGNTYNDINTNSKQYKALKEKSWLSGVIENLLVSYHFSVQSAALSHSTTQKRRIAKQSASLNQPVQSSISQFHQVKHLR